MYPNNPCCTDSFDCQGIVYSASCVIFPDIGNTPVFAINQGDSLSTVTLNILNAIDNISIGEGITLKNFNPGSCSVNNPLISNLGTNATSPSLEQFATAVSETFCQAFQQLSTLSSNSIYSAFSNLTPGCLSFTNTSTPQQILQAIINQTCQNTTSVNNLTTQVNNLSATVSTLQQQVSQIPVTPADLMPPYVPMPYIGPLDNFDSTGKGYESKGYKNVYIMNGQNGTPDWRGYAPVGAIQGVPGANPVDPRVSSLTLGVNAKTGEVSHALTIAEMPSHTHNVNDPSHSHTFTLFTENNGGGVYGSGYANTHTRGKQTYTTDPASTGISISPTGGSQAHNNMQPSVGVVWIVKLP